MAFLRVPALMPIAVCAATPGTRLAYLLSHRATFDSDEAASGLMVRRIMHGKAYGFYAGQHYGGTIEQYLQAAGYLVLGLPQNPLTLRLTEVVLSTVTAGLLYLCAQRMLGSSARAGLATLLFGVSCWYGVQGGASALGFYAAGQLLGVLVLLCGLRLRESVTPRRALGCGVAAGLAIWTAPTCLYVLLPLLWWIAPLLARSARSAAAMSVGGAIGAAPIIHLLLWRGELPVPDDPARAVSILQRLDGLVSITGPEFLGVAYTYGQGGLSGAIKLLVLGLLLSAYATALYRRRRGLLAILRLQRGESDGLDLLLLVPLVGVLLYAAAPQAGFTDTPRYLFVLYPLYAIGLAALMPRPRLRFGLASGALLALSAELCLTFFVTSSDKTTAVTPPAQYRAVASQLRGRHETVVYADYFTAMPLRYYNRDTIGVVVSLGVRRFPQPAPPVPTVYVGNIRDASIDQTMSALRRHGLTFRVTAVGDLRIVDQIAGPASPAGIGLR